MATPAGVRVLDLVRRRLVHWGTERVSEWVGEWVVGWRVGLARACMTESECSSQLSVPVRWA